VVARTQLARIRGLGAAGSGTQEYWLVKLTSVALLPLTLYLIGALVALRHAGHADMAAAVSSAWIALPLFFFILANAVHMRIGMQNVIDDYIHSKGLKKIVSAANAFFSWGASGAAVYFLLKLGIGA